MLREAPGKRDVTLIATGSEVGLAVAAADRLGKAGVDAAVVSLPSFELFRRQSRAYQATTLGHAPRIGIEAAVEQGWREWLRPDDVFVGLTGFGTSAPGGATFTHFRLTAERIAEVARSLADAASAVGR